MILPADLSAAITRAGVDPTCQPRALRDALKRAIADRRGYATWDVDQVGWRVDLLSPEEECFHSGTLDEALAWCLVWLMVDEIGACPCTGAASQHEARQRSAAARARLSASSRASITSSATVAESGSSQP